MDRVAPLSPHREVIYDLLTRAKRFHCPVSSSWELEVDALERARARLRAAGRPVGVTACLVKATALVLERYPRLNRHLFHGLWRKYEVAFEAIRCQLVVVRRGPAGERVLLPLIVERANERTVEEVQAEIDRHRTAPLEELPQFQALLRVARLPRLALSWFSFRCRSDHRTYARYFGSYGLSALAAHGGSALALHSVANTGAAFLLGGVQERAVARRGQVVAAPVLPLAVIVDHYLIDGLEVMEAVGHLRRLLADPARLGLPGDPPAGGEGAAGGPGAPDDPGPGA